MHVGLTQVCGRTRIRHQSSQTTPGSSCRKLLGAAFDFNPKGNERNSIAYTKPDKKDRVTGCLGFRAGRLRLASIGFRVKGSGFN